MTKSQIARHLAMTMGWPIHEIPLALPEVKKPRRPRVTNKAYINKAWLLGGKLWKANRAPYGKEYCWCWNHEGVASPQYYDTAGRAYVALYNHVRHKQNEKAKR